LGFSEFDQKLHMPKNLVIVESPAKAKTIEGYLGSDYTVASSYGHVRDLPKGDKAVDIEHGFKPTYEISKDKKEVVKQLRKLADDSELIYLASDDDREGEAISWHLKEALELQEEKARRIVFREITKNAIKNALKSPRGIDKDLVNAQQARRILDRIVGYEISPILWRKIKTGLSAGRVQSIAVRLVVEREREIESFEIKSNYRVTAVFKLEKGKELTAELDTRFKSEEETREFLKSCIGADFNISNLEKKPLKKSPAPPFTTSTLQQEASRKLGFSVGQTMLLAQNLYESGKISYMRTDSVTLSKDAINSAKQEVIKSYGEKFAQTRQFKTKSAGAQEAHEAIRPTNFADHKAGTDRSQQRLYDLIWKRAIASQMSDAQLEKTIVTIENNNNDYNFTATGEVVKFEGFLKAYIESSDDEDQEQGIAGGILPPLTVGQALPVAFIEARQRFNRPPARYTEASLVKKLEEMGIGRPSTYAPTISTIQKREYVVKETREGHEREYKEIILEKDRIRGDTKTEITGFEKNKLFPTNIGLVVNDFLVEYFPNIFNYSFTAKVEKEFDEIALGKTEWDSMIESFYGKFHPKVESTQQLKRADIKNVKELGTDPKSGKKVFAKIGRYGAFVQIGETEGDEKPKFASLRKGQLIDTLTLDQALELFKLPREVGRFEGETMVANIGRYGPYIRHNGKFYSLGKEEDPLTIEADRAIEIIQIKRKQESEKYIKQFDEDPDILVLKGRYGPYIKVGKKNVKIPKGKEPSELTLEECRELAEKAPAKKSFRRRKK